MRLTVPSGSGIAIGSPVTSGTSGSIPYIDASAQLAQDNANLFYNDTNDSVVFGSNVDTVTLNGASQIARLSQTDSTTTDLWGMALRKHNATAASGANFGFVRSRGSFGSPSVVSASDVLGSINFYGHDGTDYAHAARIECIVDGTPGSNDMPGAIIFKTSPDGSQTVAEVARFNALKEFHLLGERQRWLGTQMIVTDQLARDILTVSAVVMQISHVNVLIDEIIQCDGPIEVNDTVDLNNLSGSQLRILPDGGTIGGSTKSFTFASTLVINSTSNSYQFIQANGVINYQIGPLFGIPAVFMQYIPTISCTTNNATMGIAVIYNQASHIADGVVMTFVGNTWPAFWDTPTFATANGGSYDASASYRGFQSTFTINSGTFNQRTGYIVQNAGGAGTLNTQRGYFCAALTKGGTANNPLFINAPDTANASGSMIDGNITFFATAGSYGGGSRVLFLNHATTSPSSSPTGGFLVWSTSTGLMARGPSGTVTTIASP